MAMGMGWPFTSDRTVNPLEWPTSTGWPGTCVPLPP